MAEFSDKLKDWFIEMGYPLEDVENTEWKKLVCGRLTTFWKDALNVLRSKHTIENFQKNILLKQIKDFEKRENTSHAKLGVILPPPQIEYPRKQEKLQKELDIIRLELLTKKNSYNLEMEERKRKCLELHEIKQEIMEAERKIYAMKESSKKLTNDINSYKNVNKSVERIKGYFVSKNEGLQHFTNESVYTKFQEGLLWRNALSEDVKHKCNNMSISQSLSITLKDINEETILDKDVYNNSFIDTMPTSQLLNLAMNYQKELPKIVDRDIKSLSEKNNENLKIAIKQGECTPLKDSLSCLDLFHCQLVIETMKHKKETEKVKNTSSIIKLKILNLMTGNDSKIEMFNQELSQISSTVYKMHLEKELSNLIAGVGFYSKAMHNLYKLNECQNINNLINNINLKYVSLNSKIQEKSTAIITQLEQIKQDNNKIENYLLHIKKESRADKVLWQSDYKDLQDTYLKIVLNNPSVFKMETDNPFESFIYLKTIVVEYNIMKKLTENKDLLGNELKYLMRLLNNNSKLFLSNDSKDVSSSVKTSLLNWRRMEYLRPLHCIVYKIVNEVKFKNDFSNFNQINIFDPKWAESILGEYIKENLNEREEKSLLSAMEYLSKNNASKINSILDEFNETCEFVTNFMKNKENINSTPKFK